MTEQKREAAELLLSNRLFLYSLLHKLFGREPDAELLNILLDIYMEMGDTARCRELIAEIDHINETYKEQGVCREVSPDKRNQL